MWEADEYRPKIVNIYNDLLCLLWKGHFSDFDCPPQLDWMMEEICTGSDIMGGVQCINSKGGVASAAVSVGSSAPVMSMKSIRLLQVMAIVLLAMVSGGECKERVGGRQVVVYPGKVNWFKASEICRKRGMQLLTINSARENLEVVRLGEDYGLEWVWIGATDLAHKRRWVWSHNGELVEVRYWRDGEPSDKKENCIEAMMAGYPSNWNDNDCRSVRPFICEEVLEESDSAQGGVEYDVYDSDSDENGQDYNRRMIFG